MNPHRSRRGRAAALVAGSAAALALGLLAAPPPRWHGADRPEPAASRGPVRPLAGDGHGVGETGPRLRAAPADMAPALDLVRQFVLNALLSPLIDDDAPPRWTRTDLIECEPGTQLRIDGHPLEPGTPLPAVPFHVQWTLKACQVFDDGNVLDGVVDMQVFHDDDQLSAVVDAHLLDLVSHDGRLQRMQPAVFGAQLGLLPPPSP